MITRILRNVAAPESAPPWSLQAGLLALLVALAAMVIGTLVMLSLLDQSAVASLLGWILGSIVAAFYTWAALRQHRAALRLGPANIRLFIVLLFALGMAVVIDLIDLGVTGAFRPVPELLGLVSTDIGPVGWVTAVAFMLVAQPAAEELVFRGALFPVLRSAFGGWIGLLLNALLYGLFHLIAYTSEPGHLWHALGTPFLAGLVIGGVRADTRSTRAAIVAHIGFNIFALLKLVAAA